MVGNGQETPLSLLTQLRSWRPTPGGYLLPSHLLDMVPKLLVWGTQSFCLVRKYFILLCVLTLICSGGHDGSSELNTILKYDATNQTWETVGEMGEKRAGHTVTLMEDVSKLRMFLHPLDRLSESFDPPPQC